VCAREYVVGVWMCVRERVCVCALSVWVRERERKRVCEGGWVEGCMHVCARAHWCIPRSVAVVCCSVLQCVAVCCSVLQCFAVCCSVLQRVAEFGSALR